MKEENVLKQALEKLNSPRTPRATTPSSAAIDTATTTVPWASLPVEILGNIVRLIGRNPNYTRSFSQVCSAWRASVASEKLMLKELEFKTLRLIPTLTKIDNSASSTACLEFRKLEKRELPWIVEKAASASNMAASILSARFYQLQGLEKESKKHWVRAARMGHPEACWRLGVAYYHGDALTLQQDSEEALFWLNKAAKTLITATVDVENSPSSSTSSTTSIVFPTKLHFDSEQCLLMSDSLCIISLKEASHILGVIHLDGDATKQDTGVAIKWLQMAEMCGCLEAGRMLQSLFRSGQY